jgi:hypothetical protein
VQTKGTRKRSKRGGGGGGGGEKKERGRGTKRCSLRPPTLSSFIADGYKRERRCFLQGVSLFISCAINALFDPRGRQVEIYGH